MTLLTHKILQEQVAMGVTLMMLEGVFEGDQPNLLKNTSPQPQPKECLCMSTDLDFNYFNHTSPLSDGINKLIDDDLQHKNGQHPQRDYLGASRLGEPCVRALQYEYTQTPRDKAYTGQTLRIFEMGHTLEKMAWNWLQGAGFEIETHQPTTGEVYGFSVAQGQLQGHVDGIVWQVPEGLEQDIQVPAIWECKSLNARSWKQLVEKGVKIAKPVYAVQIALYQAYLEELIPGLSQNPALLTAVNKDTSELYHELVPFDAGLAQTASDRAVTIFRATQAGETLPRITQDPDSFYCRFCNWQTTCWKEIY